MSKVKNYLSLVKFSHTIFAMPFAFIGFSLGVRYRKLLHDSFVPTNKESYTFQNLDLGSELIEFVAKFFLVLICMISARSADRKSVV